MIPLFTAVEKSIAVNISRRMKASRRKFYDFLEKTDGGDFLAYYKERKLIIRFAFEKYLLQNPKVKYYLLLYMLDTS